VSEKQRSCGGEFGVAALAQGRLMDFILKPGVHWRRMTELGRLVPNAFARHLIAASKMETAPAGTRGPLDYRFSGVIVIA
jgi:hypothetical protein